MSKQKRKSDCQINVRYGLTTNTKYRVPRTRARWCVPPENLNLRCRGIYPFDAYGRGTHFFRYYCLYNRSRDNTPFSDYEFDKKNKNKIPPSFRSSRLLILRHNRRRGDSRVRPKTCYRRKKITRVIFAKPSP